MSYPCDRFAAFLAHCLNSELEAQMQVDVGALYAQLTEALAVRYAEPLLYYPVYAARMSREEAAALYFDRYLARRLLLSGRVELSVAHRLLEALCRRGVDGSWSAATLARQVPPIPGDTPDAATLAMPKGVDHCRRRLGALPDTLSAGSASPTIRGRRGPVWLTAGVWRVPVPEELSSWDAIVCGPPVLRSLAPGEPFNRFCSVVIDCVRTANRPFQELLGLKRGLCPFDWMDVLSIQQARALRKFLATLEELGGHDSPADWGRAYQRCPVPGFEDAASLWGSEIGLALRHALGEPASGPVFAAAEEPEASTGEYLAEPEFMDQLIRLEADGVITAAEHRLLADLYRGVTIEELRRRPESQFAARRVGGTLEALATDLRRRVAEWAREPASELPA